MGKVQQPSSIRQVIPKVRSAERETAQRVCRTLYGKPWEEPGNEEPDSLVEQRRLVIDRMRKMFPRREEDFVWK